MTGLIGTLCLTAMMTTSSLSSASYSGGGWPDGGESNLPDAGVWDLDGDGKIEDLESFIDPWIYVSVPDMGTYQLREVLQVGTQGYNAINAYGVPLESFSPTALFTDRPGTNIPGIVLLTPTAGCLGDFNHDGRVDSADLLLFALRFAEHDPSADLNHDGRVDLYDQLLFFSLIGRPCNPI